MYTSKRLAQIKLWNTANIKKKGRGSFLFLLLWDSQSTQKFGFFLFKDECIGQHSVLVHIVQKDQHFASPKPRPILSVFSIKKTRNLVVSFQRNVFVQNLASEIYFHYVIQNRKEHWNDFLISSVNLFLIYFTPSILQFLTWCSTMKFCNYTHSGQTFSWPEKTGSNSRKLKGKVWGKDNLGLRR